MADRPEAGSLLLVESLCLGAPAARRREAAAKPFEDTLRACYAEAPKRGEASPTAVRGAIGGYRHFAYRCLRRHQPEALTENAETLADWMLGYQRRGRRHLLPESFFAGLPSQLAADEEAEDGDLPDWQEPPASRRSRRTLTQRQRIVHAMARLAAENGYASLSVPAISGEAGISNQTFYQEFDSKQEAFMATIEEVSGRALAHAGRAFAAQDDWRRAIGAAVWALVCVAVAEPYFGRLAFFEVSAAGPVGLDHADAIVDRFAGYLSRQQAAVSAPPMPQPLLEAICGGIWTVIATELSNDRLDGLRGLAPELADFALVPFGPAGAAAAQA
jgi:AcrR family transcriptional regulator